MGHVTPGPVPVEYPDGGDERERLRRESRQRIRSLRARSSRGLWAMSLFLVVSIAALNDFGFLPPLPGQAKVLLGEAPSALMISGLLVLYTFSALVLTLARMISDSGATGGYYHVAYLWAFYVFYHLSGALAENFWAVLAAGTTILTLESYHIWTWCSSRIKDELDFLERVDKGNPPVPPGSFP